MLSSDPYRSRCRGSGYCCFMRYNPNGNTVDGCNENCAKKLCEGAGGVWRVKNKEHRKYICQTSRGNIEMYHIII